MKVSLAQYETCPPAWFVVFRQTRCAPDFHHAHLLGITSKFPTCEG